MTSRMVLKNGLFAIGILIGICGGALAAESPTDSLANGFNKDLHSTLDVKHQAKYSKDGADTCISCHDEDSEYPVLDIFKTAHGSAATRNGPFSESAQQCETCHGPAGKHSKKRIRKGKSREKMIAFKSDEAVPIETKTEICLGCHQQNDLNHWQGSQHQLNDTTCTDCHQIHSRRDPMADKSMQVQRCGQCHVSQKLAVNRMSTHPLRNGQMGCSDCHQPHDSDGEKLLIGETVNDTCYQCHAEKRGPFLWEHEPVSDSCVNCHLPHGGNQPAMLTQRAPFLCQNCHSSGGHVSFAYGSDSLPSGNPSTFLLGRSCANCHSQVHGSNHPSGSRLQR